MGASSCRLALVRTHYILGEVEEADKLMTAAGGQMLFYSLSVQKSHEARKVDFVTPKVPEKGE
ncbi:MAG: hypothetical protein ACSHX6_14845 [Akkermansiaceae bacterium]